MPRGGSTFRLKVKTGDVLRGGGGRLTNWGFVLPLMWFKREPGTSTLLLLLLPLLWQQHPLLHICRSAESVRLNCVCVSACMCVCEKEGEVDFRVRVTARNDCRVRKRETENE